MSAHEERMGRFRSEFDLSELGYHERRILREALEDRVAALSAIVRAGHEAEMDLITVQDMLSEVEEQEDK